MPQKTRAYAMRPTVGVRRGVTLILRRVIADFDNGFERLFPDASERNLMDIMEAANWLEQYADEDWDG